MQRKHIKNIYGGEFENFIGFPPIHGQELRAHGSSRKADAQNRVNPAEFNQRNCAFPESDAAPRSAGQLETRASQLKLKKLRNLREEPGETMQNSTIRCS